MLKELWREDVQKNSRPAVLAPERRRAVQWRAIWPGVEHMQERFRPVTSPG